LLSVQAIVEEAVIQAKESCKLPKPDLCRKSHIWCRKFTTLLCLDTLLYEPAFIIEISSSSDK
jgi:hypothetical protein